MCLKKNYNNIEIDNYLIESLDNQIQQSEEKNQIKKIKEKKDNDLIESIENDIYNLLN